MLQHLTIKNSCRGLDTSHNIVHKIVNGLVAGLFSLFIVSSVQAAGPMNPNDNISTSGINCKKNPTHPLCKGNPQAAEVEVSLSITIKVGKKKKTLHGTRDKIAAQLKQFLKNEKVDRKTRKSVVKELDKLLATTPAKKGSRAQSQVPCRGGKGCQSPQGTTVMIGLKVRF